MLREHELNSRGRNESEIAFPADITSFWLSVVRKRRPARAWQSPASWLGPVVGSRMRRRYGACGSSCRVGSTLCQRNPGHADVAVQKGLAGHAVALPRTASSVRCLRSFGLMASVFSSPLSIRQLQVPHSPPPHLKGMPPCSRSDTRSRLLFSGAVDGLAAIGEEGDLDHRWPRAVVTRRRQSPSCAGSFPCDRTSSDARVP